MPETIGKKQQNQEVTVNVATRIDTIVRTMHEDFEKWLRSEKKDTYWVQAPEGSEAFARLAKEQFVDELRANEEKVLHMAAADFPAWMRFESERAVLKRENEKRKKQGRRPLQIPWDNRFLSSVPSCKQVIIDCLREVVSTPRFKHKRWKDPVKDGTATSIGFRMDSAFWEVLSKTQDRWMSEMLYSVRDKHDPKQASTGNPLEVGQRLLTAEQMLNGDIEVWFRDPLPKIDQLNLLQDISYPKPEEVKRPTVKSKPKKKFKSKKEVKAEQQKLRQEVQAEVDAQEPEQVVVATASSVVTETIEALDTIGEQLGKGVCKALDAIVNPEKAVD
jgi:hypothetical protein